jgi:hypothetical protein
MAHVFHSFFNTYSAFDKSHAWAPSVQIDDVLTMHLNHVLETAGVIVLFEQDGVWERHNSFYAHDSS